MAKRKKKSSKTSYSQQIAGIATIGMPTPVQQVAKSKWGSKLLLILVPILIASGVITISFSGGLPSISVNKDRAVVVGEQVTTEAIKAAEKLKQYGDSSYR